MALIVKASDLKFKYPRDSQHRNLPKYEGKPDPAPFNRNDLYEILPLLAAVMTGLNTDDGTVLHLLEDILNSRMPRFIESREDVYDFLLGAAQECLKP